MGEFLLQNRNSTTVPKSATSQVLPKHLWRRSGVDIVVFPARGASNRQLGTRLDGINRRESAVPLTEKRPLVIESFCQAERTRSNMTRPNAGAAVLLASVGGNQDCPDVGAEHPDVVSGVQFGLCNESDLGIVDGHRDQCGRGGQGQPRRVCG